MANVEGNLKYRNEMKVIRGDVSENKTFMCSQPDGLQLFN